ncbi:MAG TPA: AraC family transcriptional regulator [Archangium sp.]|nr:AraC family transcriptional regulator [Archangium sp.]
MASIEEELPQAVKRWRPQQLPGVELLHGSSTRQEERSMYEDYAVEYTIMGLYERHHRNTLHQGGAGSLTLGHPGETYRIRQLQPLRVVRVLYFDPAEAARVARELGGRGDPIIFTASKVDVPELTRALLQFHQVVSDPHAPRLEVECRYTHLVQLMAVHCVRCAPPGGLRSPERQAVRRARELLEARWDQNVSLDELALHSGLSQFHLLREFRQQMGIPPHAYQLQLRLFRARGLLRRGAPPREVAVQVGFTDQSHLTRHFKKAFWLTPGEYARSCAG